MTSRSWCFTIFNTDDTRVDFSEPEGLGVLLERCSGFRYAIYQLELCGETGREHLQGYLELSQSVRLSAVKRHLGDNVHLERRRGTRDQARDYCRKESTRSLGPFEFGCWKAGGAGKRTDLDAVKLILDEGGSIKDVADLHFGVFLKYHNGLGKYLHLSSPVRTEKTKLHIFWGEAGTGKTRKVWDNHDRDDVYALPQPNGGSVWFDGMGVRKVLLLDDFYGWIPLSLLLKLADRYPLSVPVKGGMIQYACTHIYITSNKPWQEWYGWEVLGNNLKAAFERRIDVIEEF